MHRSRLTAIGIDVPSDVHEQEGAFWAGALGRDVERDEDGTYLTVGQVAHVEVFVQRVGDEGPRIHLDVETDDVDDGVMRFGNPAPVGAVAGGPAADGQAEPVPVTSS